VCVSGAVRSVTVTKCNFSKDQHSLPEDGPDGPKHLGANE
jgi:hypothetical protein